VYGFAPNCSQASLEAALGRMVVSTLVSTPDLLITTGKILHTLTARSVIRDWDSGVLDKEKAEHKLVRRDRKQDVIRLSIQYNIVTQFTSFVAIEHRDKNEDLSKLQALKIADLLGEEEVDKLAYIGWEAKEKAREATSDQLTPEQEIDEILKVAAFEPLQSAEISYKQAQVLASSLSPTHGSRLRANLAYATFLVDQKGSVEEALVLAKTSFDDAISELDTLSEDSYKDSTLIMQLLRDKLTLWTADDKFG